MLQGYTLGRLASEMLTKILEVKTNQLIHHISIPGDNVIVINAEDPVTGQEIRPEDLLSSFEICWWNERTGSNEKTKQKT